MKVCPFCAEQIQDGAIVCKHCGKNLPTPAVAPAKPATNWKRVGIISLVVLVLLIVIAIIGGNNGGQSQTSKPVVNTTSPAQAPAPTYKPIPYTVYDQWNIPNGGVGEDIVISPSYLNQADMTSLGLTLKNDLQNDRNAFISVFTDAKSAGMKNEVLSTDATQAEQDYFDSHHVAGYTKNANTGYNTYDFGLTGFGGANDTTINY